jgi:hypothetical protein
MSKINDYASIIVEITTDECFFSASAQESVGNVLTKNFVLIVEG